MRLVGSLAIHVVLVGALVLCQRGERAPHEPAVGPRVALIEVAAAPRAVATTAAAAPSHAPATTRGGSRRGPTRVAPRRSAGSIIGEIRYERAGDGARPGERSASGERGTSAGDGMGGGAGRGIGVGIGVGGGSAPLPELPPPPPPPVERPSKARPPRLIYPARHRELDESQLFVAKVAIDREGFVVGAKLVRGRGGPRADQASALIFRFRYAPALDDEGRAIAATIEQPFGVQ